MELRSGMNICIVTQQFNQIISGVGLHSYNLVNHLLLDGHHVWLVVPEEVEESHPNLHVITIKKPILLKNQARWFSIAWQNRSAIRRLVREVELDVIHFTDARESLFTAVEHPLIGNINDTYSAELHSLSYYRKYYRDWISRFFYYQTVHIVEGIALKKLDKVIANSDFTAQTIRKSYKVDPKNLAVIHKTIDLNQFKHERQVKVANIPQRILFVGSNMQRKGLPILIEASTIILATHPGIEFWIVGDDPQRGRMEALCAKAGVKSQFKFLGWKSQLELRSIYQQCDVFVLPALTEAFGVVLLEAMASGLAMVATNVGGIPEIIQNDKNGLLVEPCSIKDLANQVNRLISDDSLRIRLIEQAKCDVTNFDVGQMVAATYELYEEVVGMKMQLSE